jgi:hypothetical protein
MEHRQGHDLRIRGCERGGTVQMYEKLYLFLRLSLHIRVDLKLMRSIIVNFVSRWLMAVQIANFQLPERQSKLVWGWSSYRYRYPTQPPAPNALRDIYEVHKSKRVK